MAKILIQAPGSPHISTLFTDASIITIQDAFLGVRFETKDGEQLTVSMRDGGFEVEYSADFGEQGFDCGITEFKKGSVRNLVV